MREQLNRKAHEAMGKCWHETSDPDSIRVTCDKCGWSYLSGFGRFTEGAYDNILPDYCNDRNAAFELQQFTIKKVGRELFAYYLWGELGVETGFNPQGNKIFLLLYAVEATSEQLVMACLKALEAENGEKEDN